MKLSISAQAGSENKSDVLVSVSPAEDLSVKLTAKPIIVRQFGAQAVRRAVLVKEIAAQRVKTRIDVQIAPVLR